MKSERQVWQLGENNDDECTRDGPKSDDEQMLVPGRLALALIATKNVTHDVHERLAPFGVEWKPTCPPHCPDLVSGQKNDSNQQTGNPTPCAIAKVAFGQGIDRDALADDVE